MYKIKKKVKLKKYMFTIAFNSITEWTSFSKNCLSTEWEDIFLVSVFFPS